MKSQSIFWLAIFSIFLQALGQTAASSSCGITETPKTCRSGFPKSCSEIHQESGSNSPQVENCLIYPDGANGNSLEAVCDFENDGGGWTIIQKRSSGPKEEFQRIWNEYEKGFGSLDKNFWIGLENIHTLTKNGDQELRIQLEDFEGEKRYAKYSSFSVSDASDFYRLSISGFSRDSTVDDDMNYHNSFNNAALNGMQFSTIDKDNDEWPSYSCSTYYHGGWWFNGCSAANLNGLYREKGETVPYDEGIMWWSWKGNYYSLAKTEMKIRKRK